MIFNFVKDVTLRPADLEGDYTYDNRVTITINLQSKLMEKAQKMYMEVNSFIGYLNSMIREDIRKSGQLTTDRMRIFDVTFWDGEEMKIYAVCGREKEIGEYVTYMLPQDY